VNTQPISHTETIRASAPPRPSRAGVRLRTTTEKPPLRRSTAAGASTAEAIGSAAVILARALMSAVVLVVLLVALAVVLRDVGANPNNSLVKTIHEGANFFAAPFTALITFPGHPKRAITVDWGIAMLAYLCGGVVVSGYIARAGRSGVHFARRRRAPAAG
jgi:hypothetical protein